MKSYALLYHSESSETAHVDASFPRIVFGFNEGSNILFALPGQPENPHKGSYRELEAIVFEPEESEYVFVRVAFPCQEGTTQPVDISINPDRCFKCHTVRVKGATGETELPLNYPHFGRPLWSAYGLWPGAFGGSAPGAFSPAEDKALHTLCHNAAKKDDRRWMRYSFFMHHLGSDSACASDYKQSSANASLTAAVARTNWVGVASRLLKSQPFFEKYRFAVLGALLGCRSLEGFLPPAIRATHERQLGGRTLSQLIDDNKSQNAQDVERRKELLKTWGMGTLAPNTSADSPALSWRFAALRYVVDGQELDPGLSSTYWPPNAPPGGYSRNVASGKVGTDSESLAYLYRMLLPFFRKDNPLTNQPLEKIDPLSSNEPAVCQMARDLSRKALQ